MVVLTFFLGRSSSTFKKCQKRPGSGHQVDCDLFSPLCLYVNVGAGAWQYFVFWSCQISTFVRFSSFPDIQTVFKPRDQTVNLLPKASFWCHHKVGGHHWSYQQFLWNRPYGGAEDQGFTGILLIPRQHLRGNFLIDNFYIHTFLGTKKCDFSIIFRPLFPSIIHKFCYPIFNGISAQLRKKLPQKDILVTRRGTKIQIFSA